MLQLYFSAPNINPFFENLKTPLKDFTRPASQYPSGLWVALDTVFGRMVTDAIAGGGGAHGAYAPLSPAYAAAKARAGYGDQPILVRRGDMRASFLPGGTGHIFTQSALAMRWGSGIPYALYHQMGYETRSGTHVPARRPLDPGETERRNTRTQMARYVTQRYRALGFAKLGAGATVGEAKAFGKAWMESGAGL